MSEKPDKLVLLDRAARSALKIAEGDQDRAKPIMHRLYRTALSDAGYGAGIVPAVPEQPKTEPLILLCAFCERAPEPEEPWRYTKDGRVACGKCRCKAWVKPLLLTQAEHDVVAAA